MQKVEGTNPFSRFPWLHHLVDRIPDKAVDGAAILLREVTDGRRVGRAHEAARRRLAMFSRRSGSIFRHS